MTLLLHFLLLLLSMGFLDCLQEIAILSSFLSGPAIQLVMILLEMQHSSEMLQELPAMLLLLLLQVVMVEEMLKTAMNSEKSTCFLLPLMLCPSSMREEMEETGRIVVLMLVKQMMKQGSDSVMWL